MQQRIRRTAGANVQQWVLTGNSCQTWLFEAVRQHNSFYDIRTLQTAFVVYEYNYFYWDESE
ncbi:MAG: hypothetical protein ACI4I9_02075 [Porcipelethomonas sp.]